MKTFFKWTATILGALILLVVIFYGIVYFSTESKMNKTYEYAVNAIPVPADSASLANGMRLANVQGCTECHGNNLEGRVILEDPMVGRFVGTNLTRGKGGSGNSYGAEDILRVLRHGVKKDGKSVLLMPAEVFSKLSDEETGQIIAYVKSVPPTDNELPSLEIGPMARLLFFLGQMPLTTASVIPHDYTPPRKIASSATVEYGKYMVQICTACHHDNLKGGPMAGAPPDWPPATDISLNGKLGKYTEQDFFTALRNGKTPEGKEMKQDYMPWKNFAFMTDEEIKSIWLYIQTVK